MIFYFVMPAKMYPVKFLFFSPNKSQWKSSIEIFKRALGYDMSVEGRLYEDKIETFFKLINVHQITYPLFLYSAIDEWCHKIMSGQKQTLEFRNKYKYHTFFAVDLSLWYRVQWELNSTMHLQHLALNLWQGWVLRKCGQWVLLWSEKLLWCQ